MMWEACLRGNTTMMIWLSKQMLGYTDKVEQQIGADVSAHVVYETQWGSSSESKEDT